MIVVALSRLVEDRFPANVMDLRLILVDA